MKQVDIYLSDIFMSQRMDVSSCYGQAEMKNLVPLSRYMEVKGGKRIPKGMSFSIVKTDYLYLRLSDIDDFEKIDYDKLKCIDEKIYDILKRYEVKNGQVVFSNAGTIGRVFVVNNIPDGKHVVLTENCAKLLPKTDDILPEYISLVLNCSFVQKQIEQNSVLTTIPKIGLDRISRLMIPSPPSLNDQKKIVALYNNAMNVRHAKIKEGMLLLDTIDEYIDNCLQTNDRLDSIDGRSIFYSNLSSVIGNRLDVASKKSRYDLTSKVYPNEKLSSIVEIDPAIRFSPFDTTMRISFIPMECIDERYGEILEYREITMSESKGYTRFEEGDLLWAKISPCMQNGKSAIAKNLKNGMGCGSTEYFVIRSKNANVLIDYIYILLRHRDVLKAAQSSFGGSAGQQRVSCQYLKSIILPVPDFATQNAIVEEVYKIKDRAKLLLQEGDAISNEVKQKVEKLIIG